MHIGRISRHRYDALSQFVVVAQPVSKDFTGFDGGIYDYAVHYHNAVWRLFLAAILCAFLISTGDIVAMQVCQFQKDRDEQAWSKFTWGISTEVQR